MQLDPGWINFAQVQEGTVIGKRGDNSAFTAPREGMLLSRNTQAEPTQATQRRRYPKKFTILRRLCRATHRTLARALSYFPLPRKS